MSSDMLSNVLIIIGAALLSIAGALVAPSLGFAVAGVAILCAGLFFIDVDPGDGG